MSSSRLLGPLAPLARAHVLRAAPAVAARQASPSQRLHTSPPSWRAGVSASAQSTSSSHQDWRLFGRWSLVIGVATGVSGIALIGYLREGRRSLIPQVLAAEEKKEGEEETSKVSRHEIRYKDFASFVFKGEPYMSTRDFLDSVTRDEPRTSDLEVLDDKLVSNLLKKTLSRSKGSSHLFRDMWDGGILTYGDYLFLLTALTKTRRHFEVAFRMIDIDGSDFIDIKEFLRMEEQVTRQRDNAVSSRKRRSHSTPEEHIRSHLLIEQQKLERSSLSVHLFGQKGNQKLYSKDFFKLIEDLQCEVREIEFNKYSGGSPTICEEDFARILLQHTTWDLEPVFHRLRTQLHHKKGITFQQYTDFCQLLNSLDDFMIAMTMYNIAGKPVTQDEFARAALVCLGKPLDSSVVETVFQIFDVDGDSKLSHREFLSVMKNWKLRGSKIRDQKRQGLYAQFKTCVKMEMKTK